MVLELLRRVDRHVIPATPWVLLAALIAVSVTSALTLGLSEVDLLAFVSDNQLPAHLRTALLRCVFGPAAIAFALLVAQLVRPIPLGKLQLVVKLASPLALAAPALMLSVYGWWAEHELEFLLLLAATTVAAEVLLLPPDEPQRIGERKGSPCRALYMRIS